MEVAKLSHPKAAPQIIQEALVITVTGLGPRIRHHQAAQVLLTEVLLVQLYKPETQLTEHTKVELLARSILLVSKPHPVIRIDLLQELQLLRVDLLLSSQRTLLFLTALVLTHQVVLVAKWMLLILQAYTMRLQANHLIKTWVCTSAKAVKYFITQKVLPFL